MPCRLIRSWHHSISLNAKLYFSLTSRGLLHKRVCHIQDSHLGHAFGFLSSWIDPHSQNQMIKPLQGVDHWTEFTVRAETRKVSECYPTVSSHTGERALPISAAPLLSSSNGFCSTFSPSVIKRWYFYTNSKSTQSERNFLSRMLTRSWRNLTRSVRSCV